MQTSHIIERVRAMELREQELSNIEFRCLLVITLLGEKAIPARIARWLGRTTHATSELLHRMEKAGLVERVKHPSSNRKVRIAITAKGKEKYEQAKQAQSIEAIMSRLPDSKAQRVALRSHLETLRDAAYEYLGQASTPPFPASVKGLK